MFKIGDLVRIKENFWLYPTTTKLGYNDKMKEMQGQDYIVEQKNVSGCKYYYRLAVADYKHYWVWDEAWLEPTIEIKDVYTDELDLLFTGD